MQTRLVPDFSCIEKNLKRNEALLFVCQEMDAAVVFT